MIEPSRWAGASQNWKLNVCLMIPNHQYVLDSMFILRVVASGRQRLARTTPGDAELLQTSKITCGVKICTWEFLMKFKSTFIHKKGSKLIKVSKLHAVLTSGIGRTRKQTK